MGMKVNALIAIVAIMIIWNALQEARMNNIETSRARLAEKVYTFDAYTEYFVGRLCDVEDKVKLQSGMLPAPEGGVTYELDK